MYIAFKWLVGLTAAMWISMCIIDVCYINKKSIRKDIMTSSLEWATYENITLQRQVDYPAQNNSFKENYNQNRIHIFHYTMFFAGAFSVSIYNKKAEIISDLKTTLAKIDLVAFKMVLAKSLKKAALLVNVAMKKIVALFWGSAVLLFLKNYNIRRARENITDHHKKINMVLLQKLRELDEERAKLRQLLITALHENKNLRIQHKLESMAKNRLLKHVEDTQKQFKQNRKNYVSFQQLYLVTHQENLFLKARIHKLSQEKEVMRKDLMNIINKLQQLKNNDLTNNTLCSNFIMKPSRNLLNADVNTEVQRFLEESPMSNIAGRRQTTNENLDKDIPIESNDSGTLPLVSDAPKLKGLPGECILTVKDKNGFIEKLYEYDFETTFDSGDVRRIREYSVYFDKDCLLDFSRSRTIVTEIEKPSPAGYLTNERFITGSEAFQKFLKNNKNIVSTSRSPPRLLSI